MGARRLGKFRATGLRAAVVAAALACSWGCGGRTADGAEPAATRAGYAALAGSCGLVFPADHGVHPRYRTEWWYYTGHLHAADGGRFGYQWTIFRRRTGSDAARTRWPEPASRWRTEQLYMGHMALSDLAGGRHTQAAVLARGAMGLAGVRPTADGARVFIKDWRGHITAEKHRLYGRAPQFGWRIELAPDKPLVKHGRQGYSRKGSTPSHASCYYSFTRMRAHGELWHDSRRMTVRGSGWMDHEFSSELLEPGITGWDWFGLQFEDQTELMIYFLRRSDGGLHPASSGTFVASDGAARHLTGDAIERRVVDSWQSPRSGGVYPVKWLVKVAPLQMDLRIRAALKDQEMSFPAAQGITYWEGSVTVEGRVGGRSVRGEGYAELTGYAHPFDAPF